MSARPSIPALSLVSSNLLQDSIDKHRVHSDHGVYMLAEIFMLDDILETWKYGHVPSHNYFSSLCFHNPILHYVVQDQFQAQSTPRTAFHQEGEDDDTHAYDHVWCMGWRGRRPARVSKSRRRPEANSVRVPEVEAQSNKSSSLPRPPGSVFLKLVT